ncbi:hypothetical protein DFH29DRAFT_869957 [Suillus ampliporus]|nr:hypothetical protein DFH29DRAFT_869957 [Suillus ampliporus]
MSFICHEVLGSFADVPALICVNGASSDSTVSLPFLHNCNVPRSVFEHNGVVVESSSGPARVPTVDGWYNSRQTFRSVYLNGCDVELGRDWLSFVNARFDGSRFLRPLETDLAQLSVGHTWNVQPGDDLFTCSSAIQVESCLATQAGSSSVTQAGVSSSNDNGHDVDNFFGGYEKLRRPALSALATAHGLSVPANLSIEDLREMIYHHVERLLKANRVEFEPGLKTGRLHHTLKKHIQSLRKAKSKSSNKNQTEVRQNDCENRRRQICCEWPQIPSLELKRCLVQMFRDETSSEKLAMFIPDRQNDQHMSDDYFDRDCPLPQIPFADLKNPLSDLMLELSGVKPCSDGKYQLCLCSVCHKKLVKGKRPALSLANCTFLGDVPDKLKDLMVIEEAMIARCHAKCWIIQLKEENQNLQLSTNQHGMKGHIIIYPQCPEGIAAILPPAVDDIVTLICVIFVGSNPPSRAWLQEKAKPLIA